LVDPEAHLGTARNFLDDLRSESKGAISAGVTTWGLQPSAPALRREFKPKAEPSDVVPFSGLIPFLEEAADEASEVDVFLTPILATDEQCLEIPRLAAEFGVTSFKLYLHTKQGSSTFNKWAQQAPNGFFGFDDGMVYLAFEQAASLGAPAIVSIHPENWEIARVFRQRLMAAGRTDIGAWHEHSPHFLEAGHVRTYAYYAGITGCPLYIQHTTTPATLDEIRRARGDGVKVVSQTGAHYLMLPPETGKLNTPLREESVHPILWQALRDDTVNTLGSDHVSRPMSRAQMDKGNVWETISGFTSRVELALPMLLSEGVNQGRISLERLVQTACENPAKTFGVYPRKGAIEVGADADFVVVDLNKKSVARDKKVYAASGWTCIDGRELTGWPVMTIRSGKIVARWNDEQERNEVIDHVPGRYIRRHPGRTTYPIEPLAQPAVSGA
jgi:dihydropyrimidinase/dihydroorotase